MRRPRAKKMRQRRRRRRRRRRRKEVLQKATVRYDDLKEGLVALRGERLNSKGRERNGMDGR